MAILAGMTVAAMVTGNTVIMKPAEQSSVVAAKLMEIIRNASVPDGVVNFLPGIGEDIGPILVSHPDVDLVAFTGSQNVGLEINRAAADTDKRQQNVRASSPRWVARTRLLWTTMRILMKRLWVSSKRIQLRWAEMFRLFTSHRARCRIQSICGTPRRCDEEPDARRG